jgi:hypothetical protein
LVNRHVFMLTLRTSPLVVPQYMNWSSSHTSTQLTILLS